MRSLWFVLLLAGCTEAIDSRDYDAGVFKTIGESCDPDVAPDSECGYAPQFYCAESGVCASACNADTDCATGSCVGAGDGVAGECRLSTDGGA